jgi:hypothetical protein
MFDRSACTGIRVAADAHADMAALMALAELVRHALNDRFEPSNAPFSGATRLSRDENRGEVHATPDEADAAGATPRTAADRSVRGRTAEEDRRLPAWSGLPRETQAALTSLITRLILEHADKTRIGPVTEVGHDL